MKLIKKMNDYLNISLIEDNKKLSFEFFPNLDLYWTIISKKATDYEYFIIERENYELYHLFEVLFDDIKNINFNNEYPPYIETLDDLKEYQKNKEEEKIMYREYNDANYNELYNNDTITWYSDDDYHEDANILTIKKDVNKFIIEMYKKTNNYSLPGYISIRFRNSGSRYDPFNIMFMKMYNNMQYLDDINDINHQIHIEEYLYEKVKKK